jgi:uncharacterized protein YaiL (DUF2058 family)
MAKSIQDQLIAAGLVDKQRAGRIRKEKPKKSKAKKGAVIIDDTRLAAQKALQAQAEKSRAESQKIEAQRARRAIQAQIRQLIFKNRVSREGGEAPYQFLHGKSIKKIWVKPAQIDPLARGELVVSFLDNKYELLPLAVGNKIAERDPDCIVVNHAAASSRKNDEDDWYKDYDIPDDLMW